MASNLHVTDSEDHSVVQTTDWSKCALCQEVTSESLQCPAECNRSDKGAGYITLSENIWQFNKLRQLPIPINIQRLDDGHGIAVTLETNKARWHNSCKIKFNATKLQRAEKRASTSIESGSKKYTRLIVQNDQCSVIDTSCFFCEKPSLGDFLHNAATFQIDSRVRKCALDLQDERLLAKLSAGDMVALDAKYHARCLATYYNKASALRNKLDTVTNNHDKVCHGIAFAELVSYIDELRANDDKMPILKLAELNNMYTSRLIQLGVEQTSRFHSTTLKNRILGQFPDMSEHKEGRNVLLAFNKDIGLALKKAYENNYDDDAICLSKAATIVRRDMLNMKGEFTGVFDHDCQESSVPQSLLALIQMILEGPDIQSQSIGVSQEALSTSQLLQFNSHVRRRAQSKGIQHNKDRETPLPIYIGLLIHAKTRSRELVDTMFKLGLSISYDRVMNITTALGNRVCDRYNQDHKVCPANLKGNLFTTAAVDNIDHNPSSMSASGSFHGTGISLFQQPTVGKSGTDRCVLQSLDTVGHTRKVAKLPENYVTIPQVHMKKTDIVAPKVTGALKGDCDRFLQATEEETRWLRSTENSISDNAQDAIVSWAAYHSDQLPHIDLIPAISAMLPLFPDDSKSVAMMRHSMDVIQQAVHEVNPGQTPVITFDQPLYAIAKQIQWYWPGTHGEDRFVIVLGGLHIEMAGLKMIGDWLEDSGWVEAIVQANVASTGTAESFLKVTHVTRTRHVHQVTACSLFMLLKKAYNQSIGDDASGEQPLTLDEWCAVRKEESPQFLFWLTTLNLEILVLAYVRSLREADFALYTDCLTKLATWCFSLDHTNYARWLPVHVRDMASLNEMHPEVAHEFRSGKFTVQKTKHKFSSIAIDHAHEQNNAAVKGDGGAIGLTQNPDLLCRWTLAGPELARLICEFEACMLNNQKRNDDTRHHEQTKGVQTAFAKQVKSLVEVIDEMGNPFTDDGKDLYKLDTKEIADKAVVDAIKKIEQTGQGKYDEYVTERLQGNKPISDPIRKNKLPLFSRPPAREQSKTKLKLSSLKNDCALFSRLYIACQTRDGNLKEFFQHENQAYPPCLSLHGCLRLGKKSDLLACLENYAETNGMEPDTDCVILDGAAIVNMLKPAVGNTFDQYAVTVVIPYIVGQLRKVRRLDVVWDIYVENSLKAHTRKNRGQGTRRKVNGSVLAPTNWPKFLRVDANKTELFAFLANHIVQIETDKLIVTTLGTNALCNQQHDTSGLAPCNHEEADTRMLLHTGDAAKTGLEKIMIRTVDTDVVVLAVSVAPVLPLKELWVAFGTGKHFRYIPAHAIAASLGRNRAIALPMFHAYTGCDTVSSFANRGKKTAWDIWNSYGDLTDALLAVSAAPQDIPEESIIVLERFTILLYNRTSSLGDINEARQELFVKKGRQMEDIPPTKDALSQHMKRAVYQGGHIWGQVLDVAPSLPTPTAWGWSDPNDFKPVWTTLPQASQSSRELLCCGCKKGCRGACRCRKAVLKCTALCHCGGDCGD